MTTWRLSVLTGALVLRAIIGRADLMASGAATVAPKSSVPKIHFAAPVFDFGRIGAGTLVQHDYFFTNAGTATLMVTGVQPECDCTTVGSWSVRVEAGQTGMIPIRFDSAGYDGAISKRILVTTNDPAQAQVVLALKGVVSNPIAVTPPNAFFTAVAGTTGSATKVIRITNHTGEPLILSAPACHNRAFAVELKTVRPGKEFELRVTTVPPLAAGTAVGLITIKTNSSPMPVIAITALAVVQKAVTVSPTEIRLPRGPLPSSFRTQVAIRDNSGSVRFAVSDPAVNLPDATAAVQEVQAGRAFNVRLTFPAGFELPAGGRAALKVKTTHPQVPVITVPILPEQPQSGAPADQPAADQHTNPPPLAGAAPERATPASTAPSASGQ